MGQAISMFVKSEKLELQKQNAEWQRKWDKASAAKDLAHKQVVEQLRAKLKDSRDEAEDIAMAKRTDYDAIAMFTSLSSFAQSNEFDILKSVCSKFDIASPQDVRIVAVVGLFDKGKTFLINMLFGKSLASGKIYSTQGLSFLYVPDRRMLVVDTAGIQSTVSFRPESGVEPIVDAQTTEGFLFELISRISDQLIFVVSYFTWLEQKYVSMFHNKDKIHGRHRELLVVHNLRTTTRDHDHRKGS